jgi:opacity protein-like surface antigen
VKSIRRLCLQCRCFLRGTANYGITVSLCLLYVSLSASAQTRFTGQAGVGATPLVGQLSSDLSTGWHVSAGGGVKVGSQFATTLDYNYHDFGASHFAFDQFPIPDVKTHMWSLTVNPRFQIPTGSRISPYVVGGVGYYRRTVEVTTPSLLQGLPLAPILNVLLPFVPSLSLGSVNQSGIGGSLGGGFDIKFKNEDSSPRFFTEARYEYADIGSSPTRMVPVTAGIRW